MPVKEESFRIGSGRYVQRKGLLNTCGAEIMRYGKSPLIVGGKTALSLTKETVSASVASVCEKYEFVEHVGTCNEKRAGELAAYAKEQGYDVIVGVGGGVIMDFAKLIAELAVLPVVNIPTSSATCAAYTPLSVCYTPEGKTVGTKHYTHEVNAVLVDTAVVGKQPVRLLLAGVFDALAKYVEIRQRFQEDDYPMGLDYAFVMAKHSYDLLNRKMGKCLQDVEAGQVTEDVEEVIFNTIAATGVISGIARGSNQCALAHKFYETTRVLFPETAKPYLHGEIVGVGMLLQNHFNGVPENNDALQALMKQHGMPSCITDVGVELSEEMFQEYYRRICASSAIDETNADLWTLR